MEKNTAGAAETPTGVLDWFGAILAPQFLHGICDGRWLRGEATLAGGGRSPLAVQAAGAVLDPEGRFRGSAVGQHSDLDISRDAIASVTQRPLSLDVLAEASRVGRECPLGRFGGQQGGLLWLVGLGEEGALLTPYSRERGLWRDRLHAAKAAGMLGNLLAGTLGRIEQKLTLISDRFWEEGELSARGGHTGNPN